MAKLLNVQIFSPEYRLAPENPYPACLEDSLYPTINILEDSEHLRIDLKRYALIGDSAGADIAMWVENEITKLRSQGELSFRKPRLCVPIYPCVHSFLYDFYPSLRAKKANKFLKPSFFTSRCLYLLGFNGHDKIINEIVQKNYHVSNEIRRDAAIIEVVKEDASDFIRTVTNRFDIDVPNTDLYLGDEQCWYGAVYKEKSVTHVYFSVTHNA